MTLFYSHYLIVLIHVTLVSTSNLQFVQVAGQISLILSI